MKFKLEKRDEWKIVQVDVSEHKVLEKSAFYITGHTKSAFQTKEKYDNSSMTNTQVRYAQKKIDFLIVV